MNLMLTISDVEFIGSYPLAYVSCDILR
jgi:hypothetical protein